jgi:midasin (ATPase involved in ribosome maturation)
VNCSPLPRCSICVVPVPSCPLQVCQLYALLYQRPLHIVNCHQHTETADFLGGLRPARTKHVEEGDGVGSTSKALFEWHDGPLVSRAALLGT